MRLSLALALLMLPATATLAAEQLKPLQPDDIYRLSMVTNPVVAPDGLRVLFIRAAFDSGQDRRTGELWLAHLDEQGRVIDRRLLVGRDLAPRDASFSPDGSRIAFVAQHHGQAQIHILALAEAIPQPLTSGKLEPDTPVWSPDGKRLAFVGRVQKTPTPIPGMPAKASGTERAPEPKIVTNLFWRADGMGEIPAGADHLFVVDLAGTLTQLSDGEKDSISRAGLDWSRDGKQIVASFTPDPVNGPRESDLYLFDAQSKRTPVQLTNRPGTEYSPNVSPDGRQIAFLGSEASGKFYDMPEPWIAQFRPGMPIRKLTPALDRPVTDIEWREDSAQLHILYHDAGVTRGADVNVVDGAVTVRVPQVGGTRLYLPSAGGSLSVARGTYAYTSAFTDRPAGLGISRGAGETGSVDFNQSWAASRLPYRIESLMVKSRADGEPVQAWIAYPPNFQPGRKYPLILDIHGGPNTDYGPFFSITHGLYAAAGYIIVFANPRGSIGYGDRFANLITNAYPGQDHDDLMTVVDEVARRPYVDSHNLFIGGGSGGGVLTLWAIAKEPEKFRAAVALRPVTDWTDQVTTSDGTSFFMKHWMGATPWENPDVYRNLSPFSLVGQVKTPTMLITGEQDFRTPISQTEQYFGALQLRGVDSVMVRLPGAGHSMGRPSQWLQSVLTPIQFFNERLRK